MSQPEQLSAVILAWEESRERGEPISPEQLCRDCPELLPKRKQQVREEVIVREQMAAISHCKILSAREF